MSQPITMPMTFPDTFAGIDTDRLLDAFESGPARLRDALDGLSADQLSARPFPGKWTIQEQALHLSDSETVGTARFRYVIAQPGATLPMYDQDAWAAAPGYGGTDESALRRALSLFEAMRVSSGALLRSVPEDAWTLHGLHGEFGRVTLRQLLELYADHSELHIDRILRTRREIGSPVDLAPIFDRRLVPSADGPWPTPEPAGGGAV